MRKYSCTISLFYTHQVCGVFSVFHDCLEIGDWFWGSCHWQSVLLLFLSTVITGYNQKEPSLYCTYNLHPIWSWSVFWHLVMLMTANYRVLYVFQSPNGSSFYDMYFFWMAWMACALLTGGPVFCEPGSYTSIAF